MPADRQSNSGMLRSLPPPDLPSQQAVVSLGQVRPGPRAQNEYVDSLRPHTLPALKHAPITTGGGSVHSHPQAPSQRGPATQPVRITSIRPPLNSNVISSQPSSVPPPLKKEPIEIDGDNHTESIICNKCGKCRCGACTEPRDLPSRWLCGDKCEISLEKGVDFCTCFCCVKTVFYHCGSQDEETGRACYEDPCACCGDAPHCIKRWTCMTLMSLCLPCLWCYWPARGCMRGCTMCYNKCRKKGCQCSRKVDRKAASKHSQTRRLLVDSDSSSA
ncbi:protein sprouty homolog 2-like [Haliotis rubra]|uniref:protein sprouty homolog 2-like n=1 Tax=Haliotis rubra TaxID=36100 RepID=UPI001EE6035D|nr:protein sprouty homolog 2-like [Haliotis rubra]XP_046574100.1 protein sprouty homolog 2-like [Haliotis rubra]XP_046574101.1 protein sprouty homolog 2-like [Haliotis rubra]